MHKNQKFMLDCVVKSHLNADKKGLNLDTWIGKNDICKDRKVEDLRSQVKDKGGSEKGEASKLEDESRIETELIL